MRAFYILLLCMVVNLNGQASELFIKVYQQAKLQATVYDQIQVSGNNTFRFFDLPQGNTWVRIVNLKNNFLVVNQQLFIGYNQRVIAEVDAYGKLMIVKVVDISNTDWYSTIVYDQPYPGYPNPTYPGYPNPTYPGTGYPNPGYPYPNPGTGTSYPNEANFAAFLSIFRKESMDNNKLRLANDYVRKTALSANQIKEIARDFSFDSNRLEFAKNAYNTCYDKQNYFLLRESFSFASSYVELEKFMQTH